MSTFQGSAAHSARRTPLASGAGVPGALHALCASQPTHTPEAARLLAMKESTLRERIRMRRVPVLRVGRRVLVRSGEVERLLAGGSAGHAANARRYAACLS
jgi:excisionase family DNA binding protein